MNRIAGLVALIYVLGDPSLSLLMKLGPVSDAIICSVVALLTIPWVTSQLN